MPETNDLNASLAGAQDILFNAIVTRWGNGDFGADDPLYVLGYSQATVAAGMIEERLSEHRIPPEAPLFVFVDDSASGDVGFLNEVMDTVLDITVLRETGYRTEHAAVESLPSIDAPRPLLGRSALGWWGVAASPDNEKLVRRPPVNGW